MEGSECSGFAFFFIWKALNTISIGNLEADEKANIEMPFYEMGTTDEPSRLPTRDRNPLDEIGGK